MKTGRDAVSLPARVVHLEVVVAEQADELDDDLFHLGQVALTDGTETGHVPGVDARTKLGQGVLSLGVGSGGAEKRRSTARRRTGLRGLEVRA